MQHNKQQIQKIFNKDKRRWNQLQNNIIQSWLSTFPFFQKLKNKHQKIFNNSIKHLKLLEIISNHPSSFILQNSIEFIYVIHGTIQIQKKINISEITSKRRKRSLISNESLSPYQLLLQNQAKSNLGEVIITSKQISRIVYLNNSSLDKIMNDYFYEKTTQKIELLIKHNLFSDLDKSMLREIAQQANYRYYDFNNYIFKQNEDVLNCYILLEGTIKIQKPQNLDPRHTTRSNTTGKVQMIILNPEQVFGQEQFLFNIEKRFYSALCMTQKVKVLEINRDVFLKIMSTYFSKTNNQTIQKYQNNRISIRKKIFQQNSLIHKTIYKNKIQQQYALPQLTTQKFFQPKLNNLTTTHYNSKTIQKLQSKQQIPENKLISHIHQLLQIQTDRNNKSLRSHHPVATNPFSQKYKLYKKLIRQNNFPKLGKKITIDLF